MKPPEDLVTPGNRLEWARKRKGFESAASCARAFDWDYETYKKTENDERVLDSWEKAVRFAGPLGVNPVWVLSGKGALEPQLTADERRLIEKYRNATDEGRRGIHALADAMQRDRPFREAL
jgi:hypothetical protein